jgi:hypothetical protein
VPASLYVLAVHLAVRRSLITSCRSIPLAWRSSSNRHQNDRSTARTRPSQRPLRRLGRAVGTGPEMASQDNVNRMFSTAPPRRPTRVRDVPARPGDSGQVHRPRLARRGADTGVPVPELGGQLPSQAAAGPGQQRGLPSGIHDVSCSEYVVRISGPAVPSPVPVAAPAAAPRAPVRRGRGRGSGEDVRWAGRCRPARPPGMRRTSRASPRRGPAGGTGATAR